MFKHAPIALTEELCNWLIEHDEAVGDDFERIDFRRALFNAIVSQNKRALLLPLIQSCAEMDYEERVYSLVVQQLEKATPFPFTTHEWKQILIQMY